MSLVGLVDIVRETPWMDSQISGLSPFSSSHPIMIFCGRNKGWEKCRTIPKEVEEGLPDGKKTNRPEHYGNRFSSPRNKKIRKDNPELNGH